MYNYPLDELRFKFISQISAILEAQAHGYKQTECAITLSNDFHAEVSKQITQLLRIEELPDAAQHIANTMRDACCRIDDSLYYLLNQRHIRQKATQAYTQKLVLEFNEALRELQFLLTENDLLEKQRWLLESILLLHKKTTNWNAFVQDALLDFHSVFALGLFYIVFVDNNTTIIHLFFLGHAHNDTHKCWRDYFYEQLLPSIESHGANEIVIEEFLLVSNVTATYCKTPVIIELTANKAAKTQETNDFVSMAGAFIPPIFPHDEAVIRSVLSVIKIVLHSSKTLSKTFSELEYFAVHDPLTGLYNRRFFNDSLANEIERSSRYAHEFCVLVIDIDDFKDINDSFGHAAGDKALCEIATILLENTRKGDLCTRIGGDEFAVVLPEITRDGANLVAHKIISVLREKTLVTDCQARFHLSVSIGISTYPRDAKSIDELVACADTAMYHVKEIGKDGVYSANKIEGTPATSRKNRDLAITLRDALKEQRIVPYYQAIVNCQSDTVFAFETLARLKMSNGEIKPAASFIETIEKYGLSPQLDQAIITQAFNEKRLALNNKTFTNAKTFINLSAQDIQERNILGFAEELCQRLELSPKHIVFEVLERDAIVDMQVMQNFLNNLRKKGFEFALDDFGSGYNSFHYLRELHFEYVKIDGSFVRNITTSKVDFALVNNLASLCQDLGILTIAEFVEDAKTYQILKEIGINYAQGYHLSLPNPFMHFEFDQPTL